MKSEIKAPLPSPNFNALQSTPSNAKLPTASFQVTSLGGLKASSQRPLGSRVLQVAKRFPRDKDINQKNAFVHKKKRESIFCEPCEMELGSEKELHHHRMQHRRCQVDGCTYRGHPSVMDRHMEVFHSSGMFEKCPRLSTPEEIAAWREERRKKFPTLANVAIMKQAEEQRQQRGERLNTNRSRFGRREERSRILNRPAETEEHNDHGQTNKRAPRKNKRKYKNKRQEGDQRKSAPPVEKASKDSSIANGDICVFKGTTFMDDYQHTKKRERVREENALTSLIRIYGSDDESSSSDDGDGTEHDITTSNSNLMEAQTAVASDDLCKETVNAPDAIEKLTSEEPTPEVANEMTNEAKQGGQVMDASLPMALASPEIEGETPPAPLQKHETAPGADGDSSSNEAPDEIPIQKNCDIPQPAPTSHQHHLPTQQRGPLRTIPKRKRKYGLDYTKLRRRPQNTMLAKLLESDIRHERNVLLQCVRFVCENNFFGIGQK